MANEEKPKSNEKPEAPAEKKVDKAASQTVPTDPKQDLKKLRHLRESEERKGKKNG